MVVFRLDSLLWLVPAIAFGGETTRLRIEPGDKFAAADTLSCGDEHSEDARQCLATLSWTPAKFTVHLEAADPGCGNYLVRFPSARPIGHATNDLVSMEWFAAHDAENEVREALAIVVVHESGRSMTVGRLIARGLSAQGLHAFLIHLPGYGARRVDESSKVGHMLTVLQQAIADVRRARDAVVALPVVDRSVVGVQGTSLGGFFTATVAGLDHGYDRVFILLAGGNLQAVVLNDSKEAIKLRRKLAAAGVTEEQVKDLVRQVEPLRLAHRINPATTWLYSGKFDDVVPPECSQALAMASHLSNDHHIELAADHYSGIVYLPQVIQQIYQRMAESPTAAQSGEAVRKAADAESYPQATSKKGLQVELVDDALALGIEHAALNVNLSQLVAPSAKDADSNLLRWTTDGRTFCFHRDRVEQLDRTIRTLSERGVLIHLIILVYQSDDDGVNRIMLHPGYDQAAPNRLSAFNIHTADGRAWLAATMEFLAQRWSLPDQQYGRVAGYIFGNEVNSHWWWSNMGRVTMSEFAADYWQALRIVQRAVRRQSPWGRVYVSLDHHWSVRFPAGDEMQAFAGKDFIDELARRTREEDGDVDWHIAYHPYPENLFEPRFWNDKTALHNADTPRITFKNIDVLTEYLRRPELLYEGKPRRVILSEQGFHTPDGPTGEAVQAAAYCYAYRKIAKLDGVDAFILHRHVDHPHEGGLRLGLRRYAPEAADPRPKKLIYDCFHQADRSDWEGAFRFALPIIGIRSWDEVSR